VSTGVAFRGIFTIPSTPFREDGEIDVPSFRAVVDFCVACGAHGLVFPVNASEFTSLSDVERFALSEVLVEQNANMALQIAHHGYVMENGRVVMEGEAANLRENPDVKEFYLGVSAGGAARSYKDVKSYKRRKRWL